MRRRSQRAFVCSFGVCVLQRDLVRDKSRVESRTGRPASAGCSGLSGDVSGVVLLAVGNATGVAVAGDGPSCGVRRRRVPRREAVS
jgi:hypothetical protein